MGNWLHSAWSGLSSSDRIALASLLVAMVTAYIAYLAIPKPEKKTPGDAPPLTPDERRRLLDIVQSDRVDPRLSQGLRAAVRVDFGLTETPAAVPARLRTYAQQESGPPQEQPIRGSIHDIFENTARGRLLILGAPGTGKTNLLLELAQSLIDEARRDPERAIPIVFSLPRWTLGESKRTLADWMKDDLASEYGLSRAAADALVRKDRILPLLDGLDEVAEHRREDCVDAIHGFQKDRNLGPLAVCCRVAEYEAIRKKLDLGAAVRVEKLTRQDVEHAIADPRMARVREALETDPQLWEVVDTPLWLHVLYGAAQTAQPSGTQELAPRERLYARYVEYALGRREGSPGKRTAREPLLRRLGWLAGEMSRRDQPQFALEDLDFSWLPTRGSRSAARLFIGLTSGLVFALLFILVLGLDWWILGFPIGLAVGLIVIRKCQAMEEIRFAWRKAVRGLVGLIAGLVVGVVLGSVGFFVGGTLLGALGLIVGLIIGPIAGVVLGLGAILQPRTVSRRAAPNRGTLRSLRYALWISLSPFAVLLCTKFVSDDVVRGTILVLGIPVFLAALVIAFIKGGAFAVRHYTVCLFLRLAGFAPLGYVPFLNEAAQRLFLIRRGGSYEFFHITFRDYMAHAYDPRKRS
jgi:hypothetical protein